MGSAFEHTSPSVLVLEIVIFYREHIKFSSQTESEVFKQYKTSRQVV